jgi:glycosyltransferase involved in cell wall biosynthesis
MSDGADIPPVAIVHDYLATVGGAERFLLSLHRAFPDAPIYTSLYEPSATFSEFKDLDIRVSGLNRSAFLRSNYRMAFPFLAPTFSHMHVPARVVLCSSSGWSHGVSTDGTKLVYCLSPARWLYKPGDYFRRSTGRNPLGGDGPVAEHIHASTLSKTLVSVLRPALRRWDVAAARSAERYFTSSRSIAKEIADCYKITATVIPPPAAFSLGDDLTTAPEAAEKAETAAVSKPEALPPSFEDGYYLIVSRLERYKNVAQVITAFRELPALRLVIAGSGPQAAELKQHATSNIHFTGRVTDEELRWLYEHCAALIAPANEDYGLTPVEAATFGKPTLALRGGGYLDTVREGITGLFFDDVDPVWIARVVEKHQGMSFDSSVIAAHSEQYSEDAFVRSLRSYVEPFLD